MRVINIFRSLLMHLWCQQAWSPKLIWGGSVDVIPEGTIRSMHITSLLKDLWYLSTVHWIKWKLLTITASQVALVKNPPANAGDIRDAGLIPGSERSPGVGSGDSLQYSCLESYSMDRRAWRAAAYGVAKNRTWLSIYSATTSRHAHLIGVGDLVIRIFQSSSGADLCWLFVNLFSLHII